MEGGDDFARTALIGQALKVRPYEGSVLFAAGREAALSGQGGLALDMWKRAFHQSPDLQQGIIALLAPRFPASAIVQQLEPDVGGLRRLFSHYRQRNQIESAHTVGHHLARQLEASAEEQSGERRAAFWQQAQSVYVFLNRPTEATRCLTESVKAAPNQFAVRRKLAMQLLRQKQYREAIEQLEWCVNRRPHDFDLKKRLASARRRQNGSVANLDRKGQRSRK